MARITVALLAVTLGLLTACAAPAPGGERTDVVLPLNRAWVDGRKVAYVTTDVSDAAMARMSGANFVPRLADAIPKAGQTSVLERVYKFPRGEQISIFQSAPTPAGPANADRNYSPLWRIVLVQWRNPDRVRELKSEEELLAAEDKGEVTLNITSVVANCPVVRAADGQALKGVQ
jgi:hypothetical protein